MFLPLVLFFAFITSCAEKSNTQDLHPTFEAETNGDAFFRSKDSVNFHAYQTELPVVAFEAIKELTICQKNSATWFEQHQDELFPKIKQKIFEYYQTVYTNYKTKWSSDNKMTDVEIQRYLPYPAFPDSILGHMKPMAFIVHPSENCSENTFSIDFQCTWDPQYGLGIYVENGEVKYASLGLKTFPE